MPAGWNYDTMLSKRAPEAQRRVIDTSSDVAQVKLIAQLLGGIPDISPANAHHTAVVLADENLLMPVLTSLPETMVQSSACSTFSGLAWTQAEGQPSVQSVATDHRPSAGEAKQTLPAADTSTRPGIAAVTRKSAPSCAGPPKPASGKSAAAHTRTRNPRQMRRDTHGVTGVADDRSPREIPRPPVSRFVAVMDW
jgi:hypothetical protein